MKKNHIVSINNNSNHRFLYQKQFQEILKCFFLLMKYKQTLKVDVLITTNQEIRKISKQYRNIDKETDVLSFPFTFNQFSKSLGFNFLGEIILSYEKIKEQAKEFNHSIKREFCYLFAHGLVHLSGRDHEKEEERKEFNSIVEKIMKKVDIHR